ncbi:hypothetical protein CF319_g3214 [Tilletia indica]|nr:hypothetical protein CF319_g3214 [Tilletia indica]
MAAPTFSMSVQPPARYEYPYQQAQASSATGPSNSSNSPNTSAHGSGPGSPQGARPLPQVPQGRPQPQHQHQHQHQQVLPPQIQTSPAPPPAIHVGSIVPPSVSMSGPAGPVRGPLPTPLPQPAGAPLPHPHHAVHQQQQYQQQHQQQQQYHQHQHYQYQPQHQPQYQHHYQQQHQHQYQPPPPSQPQIHAPPQQQHYHHQPSSQSQPQIQLPPQQGQYQQQPQPQPQPPSHSQSQPQIQLPPQPQIQLPPQPQIQLPPQPQIQEPPQPPPAQHQPKQSHPQPQTSTISTADGSLCASCSKLIVGRVINAMNAFFHPTCFRCMHCSESLEHVAFFEHEGKPYCHLDYHELFSTRCFHCRTPIVDERYITINDPDLVGSAGAAAKGGEGEGEEGGREKSGVRNYHEMHFFCANCGDPFLDPNAAGSVAGANPTANLVIDDDGRVQHGGKAFVVHKGYPYCEGCHNRLHKPRCRRCKNPILTDEIINALGHKWHPDCFVCESCQRPFESPSVFVSKGKAYDEHCYKILLRQSL